MQDLTTRAAREIESLDLPDPLDLRLTKGVCPSRAAFAAAHIVAKLGVSDKLPPPEQIDWDSTLAFRRYLWSLGLGVAEAMDTAQRSLLGWEAASELIARTLAEARSGAESYPWPEVIAGAGTDGISPQSNPTFSQLVDEYVRQAQFIQSRGGTVMLLSSPFIPRLFPGSSRYVELYTEVTRQLDGPLFIHWLGPMFAPELEGYFPENSFWTIMDSNAEKIAGVKVSLLDESLETQIRLRLLPNRQIVLTGDDYHYPSLILGKPAALDGPPIRIGSREFPIGDFSHALLGIFDAIAPVAAKALEHLALGDQAAYLSLMNGTRALAELIFQFPTYLYKAGVVFLAYLNGHQDHFSLLGGLHQARPIEHYIQVFRLAAACGALRDPPEARRRMLHILRA
ncbi:DUF993 family protein [Candidatus Sumerlaeota bacterium]|nr:DUF993 family protein [Candidatus Sumerlaeota bacterium]